MVGGKSASAAKPLRDQHENSQPANNFVPCGQNGNTPSTAMSNDRTVRKLKLQRLEKAIKAGDIAACSRLRSQGCPLNDPLPESLDVPIIAALSHQKNRLCTVASTKWRQ
jgi:hypothetical protein